MIDALVTYGLPFAAALALTLVLTPLVRVWHRHLGMVDRPGERRINRTPVPRGGGVALFWGVLLGYLLVRIPGGGQIFVSLPDATTWKLFALGFVTMALGLTDDRYGLSPKVKLAGQFLVAVAVRAWAGIGFSTVFPALSPILDYPLTVLWIVGAINAFNLIDGLDGLASGIALIAVIGMGGTLIFTGHTGMTAFHCAFAGGLIGFLVYNYNPASIFLGDSGSMFLGYALAVMPFCGRTTDSLLVSVGVPLLAMGVPIFDTALAILRRSIRRMLSSGSSSGRVMTADADHLHHRILRSVGFSQRRAAWILYGISALLVALGFLSTVLRTRLGGLWLFAVTVGAFLVFKGIARVELYDAGKLLSAAVHNPLPAIRRRLARVALPFYIVADLSVIFFSFVAVRLLLSLGLDRTSYLKELPVRASVVFFALVLARTYLTVWSRAVLSNYLRLLAAAVVGSVLGSAILYYALPGANDAIWGGTALFAALMAIGFALVRLARSAIRDLFYAFDCSRLVARKDVSRVIVYGAGLRYRTFRRELVRTTSANDRIIVGLLDDDILVKGHYIGGIRIWGTLLDASEVINRLNADSVVICCKITPEWRQIVLETLKPTGVKVTYFNFEETDLGT